MNLIQQIHGFAEHYSLPFQSFPGDEATHWIKKIRFKMSSLEKIVTKWAFKNTSMKLGEIKIV